MRNWVKKMWEHKKLLALITNLKFKEEKIPWPKIQKTRDLKD